MELSYVEAVRTQEHSWWNRRIRELALTCPLRWLLLATGRAVAVVSLRRSFLPQCIRLYAYVLVGLPDGTFFQAPALPSFTHGFLTLLLVCAAITQMPVCIDVVPCVVSLEQKRENLSSASVVKHNILASYAYTQFCSCGTRKVYQA